MYRAYVALGAPAEREEGPGRSSGPGAPEIAVPPDMVPGEAGEKREAEVRPLPAGPEVHPQPVKPESAAMATDPNVPPPEPLAPLPTPPEPGEVQTTPMPMR